MVTEVGGLAGDREKHLPCLEINKRKLHENLGCPGTAPRWETNTDGGGREREGAG